MKKLIKAVLGLFKAVLGLFKIVLNFFKPRVKVVEKLLPYRPLPSVNSAVAAKYVLNKLITELETQREYYFSSEPSLIDLDSRNAGKVIGRAEVTFVTLNLIRQHLQDFIALAKGERNA